MRQLALYRSGRGLHPGSNRRHAQPLAAGENVQNLPLPLSYWFTYWTTYSLTNWISYSRTYWTTYWLTPVTSSGVGAARG